MTREMTSIKSDTKVKLGWRGVAGGGRFTSHTLYVKCQVNAQNQLRLN